MSISASDESRGQQEPQSTSDGCRYSPPHNASTVAVRFPNSSLTGSPAPAARTGLDLPNQQKLQSSILGSVITFDSPRPLEPLYPHGTVVIPMGLTAPRENLCPDPGYGPNHLFLAHQTPRRFLGATEQPAPSPHVAEETAADSAVGAQYEVLASGFLACPGQRLSQPSAGGYGSFGNPYAKVPLFLPSQTPIRHPSAQDILSSPGSGLMPGGRSMSQGIRVHRTGQPHTDRPHSDPVYTPAIRHFETDVHLEVDGEIRLHGSRTLLTRRASTTSRSPSPPLWPDDTATGACPQILSVESNH
jgi:hypothetical protein